MSGRHAAPVPLWRAAVSGFLRSFVPAVAGDLALAAVSVLVVRAVARRER